MVLATVPRSQNARGLFMSYLGVDSQYDSK